MSLSSSSSSSGSSWIDWILSLKVLLISVGVVSVAVTIILAVPLMFNFALNDLPAIWSVIASWMKPPYLYVIINGIIITIVASSRFDVNYYQENQSQQQANFNYNQPNVVPQTDLTSTELPPVSNQLRFGVIQPPAITYDDKSSVMEEPQIKRVNMDVETVDAVRGNEDEFVTSRSMWNTSQSGINSPIQPEFNFSNRKKKLATSRSAYNRKLTRTSPEGARALRVLKPKKHETLDSTWKMITDDRQMRLTRQFRKSDTFQNLHYDRPSGESTAAAAKTKVVRKSETFKDRTTYENQNQYPQSSSTHSSSDSVGKLKKELSLSDDELNRRVEAFIKKFNDDIRLQKQKSLERH